MSQNVVLFPDRDFALELTCFTQENDNYQSVMRINYNLTVPYYHIIAIIGLKHWLDGDKWDIWWLLPFKLAHLDIYRNYHSIGNANYRKMHEYMKD